MLMMGVREQHSTRSGKGSRLLSPITRADHPALTYVGCSRDSLRISAARSSSDPCTEQRSWRWFFETLFVDNNTAALRPNSSAT